MMISPILPSHDADSAAPADAFNAEVIITRKPAPELPPPFVCAICERTVEVDPFWHVRSPHRHSPPICFTCTVHEGHQVRFPGITRGDHITLKRLTAVTDALLRAATWEPKYGRFTTV